MLLQTLPICIDHSASATYIEYRETQFVIVLSGGVEVRGLAMKKSMILWCAVFALMLSGATGSAFARNGGFHGGGFHGGAGFHGGGMRYSGGPQARHGYRRFRDFRGRGVIVIGGPFFWDPYYNDPTLYPVGTVYTSPDNNYSYYCNDPAGYYPDVPSCPNGWLRVVPGDPAY
jgi:hypothetical protein